MKIQHVRVARSTNRLDEVTAFYRDVLGLEVLARFDDHDGFDGVMLGQSGDSVHFEFTRERGAIGKHEPSPEDLVVLYFDDAEWPEAERRIATAGVTVVVSHNPYWDRHGITIADPDGNRVVLHRGPWRSRRSSPETPL
jgi:catechol 2,3-dioxygenase-like lactoylglutathione lyase family enzyme